MTNEERQRAALMAQIAKKRELKEKYLRNPRAYGCPPGPERDEELGPVSRKIRERAEMLRDLVCLLKEMPKGMDLAPLLTKEADTLKLLRKETREKYEQMPEWLRHGGIGEQVRNTLLLLGGAVTLLEEMLQTMPEDSSEQLDEIVYMLENAGGPI